ncbi:MAG: hypothetical protein M1826_001481 [Phylliscum demangeonii]|nr:MAG: hypothetical protein M1826_001481 [Phylliscum demangeonii]
MAHEDGATAMRTLAVRTVSEASTDSTTSSGLKPPRTPRFAEATAVYSPLEPTRSPFADPAGTTTTHYAPQPQPSDVGFGYISGVPVDEDGARSPPPKSPLKSALRAPGTPARSMANPLSPTFHEEQQLEQREAATDVDNAKDLKVKVRVRLAKMVLRGVNFSCSLIVLSMLSSTFAIFNSTKRLPPRNTLPPWASGTAVWPQITLLVIACLSLFFSVCIMYAHCRGRRRRAEKTAVYYNMFAVCFFAFSVIMWAIGAGLLQSSRQNGGGNDLWGWSCKDNRRKQLFADDVKYALVCQLQVSAGAVRWHRSNGGSHGQNWSLLCCIIEVVVEVITIAIYAVVFCRFWSKRRLRKTMTLRDKARSDLYLAQLRTQSAPNTPHFAGPFSPGPAAEDEYSSAEKGESAPYAVTSNSHSHSHSFSSVVAPPKPFKLQPAPIRAQHAATAAVPAPLNSPAAPGEKQYDVVPIPGAYASPLSSPTHPPPAGAVSLDAAVGAPSTVR